MAAGDRQQPGRKIDSHDLCAAPGKVARHAPLAAGEVTYALPGRIGHQRFGRGDIRILADRAVHPGIVPLGDLIIRAAGHGSSPLLLADPAVTVPVAHWLKERDGRIAMLRAYSDARPFLPPA